MSIRYTQYFGVSGKALPPPHPLQLTGAWHSACRFLPFSSPFLLPKYIPMGEKAAAFSPYRQVPALFSGHLIHASPGRRRELLLKNVLQFLYYLISAEGDEAAVSLKEFIQDA